MWYTYCQLIQNAITFLIAAKINIQEKAFVQSIIHHMKKIHYYQYMNKTQSEAYKLNWEVQFLGFMYVNIYLFIIHLLLLLL